MQLASVLDGPVALAERLENRRGLLGAMKLVNVGLAMAWGFAITFVFVRLLPLHEFRAFLLLVAFANFTISAELGFSTVIYSRLRRSKLAGEGDFRSEELGVLLFVMAGIVTAGALLIIGALAAGFIPTQRPGLFFAFFLASALNILAQLARRALAALDLNLFWEGIDLLRRLGMVGLLLASLVGLPILDSVLLQLGVMALTLAVALLTVQRRLDMPLSHWWALRRGARHVRANYLADIGRTSALTLSEIAAYNAPYFTIAVATHDARPLLLFDFVFKISRALLGLIRALVETMMPLLTRYFYSGQMADFRRHLNRCLGAVLAMAAGLSVLLLAIGSSLSSLIFDGKLRLEGLEVAWICALLLGLSIMAVSVYVHNGLGRFAALILPSGGFFAGSLASAWLAPMAAQLTGGSFAVCFVAIYALVHLTVAVLHGFALTRLERSTGQ